jgi:hypothetical protein
MRDQKHARTAVRAWDPEAAEPNELAPTPCTSGCFIASRQPNTTEVQARQCPGGQLAGATLDAAGLHNSRATAARCFD